MQNLAERMVAARNLAAAREPDLRIKALIAAMSFWVLNNRIAPSHVTVDTHFRFWMRYFVESELAELETLSQQDLSHRLANWIQGALDNEMLVLSNPPVFQQASASELEGSGIRILR